MYTDLCNVCRNDSHLCEEVEDVVQPSRKKGSAGLGKVETGDGAQLDAKSLEEDGEQIGKEHDEEQSEAIGSSSGHICGIVSGINFGRQSELDLVCQWSLASSGEGALLYATAIINPGPTKEPNLTMPFFSRSTIVG